MGAPAKNERKQVRFLKMCVQQNKVRPKFLPLFLHERNKH